MKKAGICLLSIVLICGCAKSKSACVQRCVLDTLDKIRSSSYDKVSVEVLQEIQIMCEKNSEGQACIGRY